MATRFELVLAGPNPAALRAAGEEALDEIEAIESRWSLYRPDSELAHLNARAAREPVRVSPELFDFLDHARRLHAETGGAFDITIAPLVRCWGFMGASGSLPDPEALAAARQLVGMQLVSLNPADRTVHFLRNGVMLDPGAIGKGYAVGRARDILRDAGVENALIHGGTSTIVAFGRPENDPAWKVAVENPADPAKPLALLKLNNQALSVSAVWGKSFSAGGRRFGHVLDPRTGAPAENTVLAAVAMDSATESDALSTALLVLGPAGLDRITSLRPGMRALTVTETRGQFRMDSRGLNL